MAMHKLHSHRFTSFNILSYLFLRYISKLYFGRLIKLELGLWCFQTHAGVDNVLLIR